MNPQVRAWLDTKIKPQRFLSEPVEIRRVEYLAELIAVNGHSLQVGGWGVTQGGGLYGRLGLEQEEALALLTFGGFVLALSWTDKSTMDELYKELEGIWDEEKKKRERGEAPPR